MSDDLRDTVGCYGNTEVITPHMDRLANQGVRFDGAYAQYPLCGPSRASLLTGLRPRQTGILGNRTYFRDKKPDVVTLPQSLRQQGWYTAGFGKIFHTVGHTHEEQAPWIDLENSWDEGHGSNGEPQGPFTKVRNLTGGSLPWCRVGPTTGPESEESDHKSASEGIEVMRRMRDKPWFVAVGLHRPHDPFICPQAYFDLYDPATLTLNIDPPHMTEAPDLAIPPGGFKKAFSAFTDEDKRAFIHAYYACTSFADAQVGRLVAEVDRLGLRDQTMIIVMGDHGYHLGERNWWNKSTLFERSCRTPMIISAPHMAKGRVCAAPVELVDLFPTILDFVGAKTHSELAGESFVPLLKDPSLPGKGVAYSTATRGKLQGHSVRTSRWRYTEWDQGRRGVELYDQKHDPENIRNLAKDPRFAEQVSSLKTRLHRINP
ncbi:MAG: sulfatase [Planctomycetes bacterium]|nr:sulfatase [Planctomycetota bacterium]